MKVPLEWLREYVNVSLPLADLAGRLTMAGIEVEGMQTVGGSWENIVIGQIVSVDPHPNADRLRLATVDFGTGRQTVVCGAPDLKPDDRVAFAHVGARLIDGHSGQSFKLKSAKIRGIVSNGMICSEKELGISDSHEGIMVLPGDAPVGFSLADYLGDVILNLAVTPNRPDCLSVIGVAREVAALTGQSLHLAKVIYDEGASLIEPQVSVEIVAPDLCPRYSASLVSGIKIAESPKWMQQRLLACGMRPINNIVDITNYVMLEYGQPLHAFDYHQVRGRKIIVRRASDGETMVTLDGVERTLSRDTLVIADTGRAVAIAGVMGGADSEVTGQTASILLESANFNPASIHYTSRKLWLISEASMRFERGIRPEVTLPALRRATQLMLQLAGGEAARGFVDAYPGRQDRQPILLPVDEVKRILGVEFSLNEIVRALTSLGFDCKVDDSAPGVWAIAPYWRSDISLKVDLVEELARIIGYDRIPTTMLSRPLPCQELNPALTLKHKIRDSLAGYGFQEVVTYSLNSLEALANLAALPHPVEPLPIRITNPMTADQEYLRPNLRANLLAALSGNQRHEEGGIRLFELGRVYLSRGRDLPDEPEVVCGVLSGPRFEKSWHSESQQLDFYDAKGIVEGLLKKLGVAARFEKCQDEGLHPNRQVAISIKGRRVGIAGELHPKVSQAFKLYTLTCLFEISLATLLPLVAEHRMFQPIPRFPAVVRDIALVVDTAVTHQQVVDIIRGFPLVSEVKIFDVYSGVQLPVGKKSLAYRITFQSLERTLTDEEANRVQQQVLSRLSRHLGATLR
jgi:phenylalanyl-tRNA synthetase beta chain